ncbi:MAG: iron-sulfur cluster assembly scaffold protein [Candidatus Kerfeldbacteria bacterium]|nr:iron-sulfur cluster assembly scaffold protein [Candidatus Kerfeldbacteria bacterium]
MDLYQQNILDHYKHPQHRGELKAADKRSTAANPSCGDSVIFYLQTRDDKIVQARWMGEGCVLSQAAADMLAEFVQAKTLAEVVALKKEELLKLVGVELGPNRVRCALLPLEALHQALK